MRSLSSTLSKKSPLLARRPEVGTPNLSLASQYQASDFDMFTKWQGTLVVNSEGKGSMPVST